MKLEYKVQENQPHHQHSVVLNEYCSQNEVNYFNHYLYLYTYKKKY